MVQPREPEPVKTPSEPRDERSSASDQPRPEPAVVRKPDEDRRIERYPER
jgi:hypothetical protein